MTGKVGYLFPAFGGGYAKTQRELFGGYREELAKLLARAADVVDIDDARFENPDDDLRGHYASYISSCAVSSVLKRRDLYPDYAAPYSMGLFAALFDAECVCFEDGLLLTHQVCSLALASVTDGLYGMAVIVGLSHRLIADLIANRFANIEIGDVTNENVLVVSGQRTELEELLRMATERGSLHAKMMPFALPYHSRFMKALSRDIEACASTLTIAPPSHAIVSCVDQRVLLSTDDIRAEVAGNITRNMNWFLTMKKLLELGVDVFVECGASDALSKQARFFSGDFDVWHPKKFDRFFEGERFPAGQRDGGQPDLFMNQSGACGA